MLFVTRCQSEKVICCSVVLGVTRLTLLIESVNILLFRFHRYLVHHWHRDRRSASFFSSRFDREMPNRRYRLNSKLIKKHFFKRRHSTLYFFASQIPRAHIGFFAGLAKPVFYTCNTLVVQSFRTGLPDRSNWPTIVTDT